MAKSLQTSRSHPKVLPYHVMRGRSVPAHGGKARAVEKDTPEVAKNIDIERRAGKNKILNWFRLPAKGSWVPPARAGHTAVVVGTEMFVFGGIVNSERVNELAGFDFNKRVWRRLASRNTHSSCSEELPNVPGPRAFHASWAFKTDVYIHGGEGHMTEIANLASDISKDMEGILKGVCRDPFAEGDGGAPTEEGRAVFAGGGIMAGQRCKASGGFWQEDREMGSTSNRAVSLLEDLWKLDTRTLRWERLFSRLSPLGRKGHTATIAPLRGHPRVFVFGGAPIGRRGLSNALYSVEIHRLSVGQGTWERHQPGGKTPSARHGHSLTAVREGKRLVLFGGFGELGELLSDVEILEIDDDCLSWVSVKHPVGDIPAARYGHSACEVPTAAGCAVGLDGGGGVIVFGGEGRESEGQEVRPSDYHAVHLYDPEKPLAHIISACCEPPAIYDREKASRWQEVKLGHAFPVGRHCHSMAVIAGWTPPSFQPDGTLNAFELPFPRESGIYPTTLKCSEAETMPRGSPKIISHMENEDPVSRFAKTSSGVTTFQWGLEPPPCAIVFGGLNSMYVRPEIWLLPMRWREKTVHLVSSHLKREAFGNGDDVVGKRSGGELGFASAVRLKSVFSVTASATGSKNIGAGEGRARLANWEEDFWRIWQGDGVEESERSRVEKPRRASAPILTDPTRLQQHHEKVEKEFLGNSVRECDRAEEEYHAKAPELVADVEAELIYLRKLRFVAEQQLSEEVSTRMRLEEANKRLQKEAEALRSSREEAEARLRDEVKRQWREGQRAKAQCASLERLLAEAYELINMSELRHNLQIKTLMPGLYGEAGKSREERRKTEGCHNQQHQWDNQDGAFVSQVDSDGAQKHGSTGTEKRNTVMKLGVYSPPAVAAYERRRGGGPEEGEGGSRPARSLSSLGLLGMV